MNEQLDRAAVQRAELCVKYPAEFEHGFQSAFTDQDIEPCDAAGYPIGFHTWALMRRNAWWAGWNLGIRMRFRHLGASALTAIGCLMAVHAHAEAASHDPRKSENNTFVECTTLMDKCMPGTPSITKDIVCA